MTVRSAAVAACLLSLAAPSAASAAPVLGPLKPCYVSVGVDPTTGASITEDIEVTGSGFTPGSTVDVQVDGVTAQTKVPVDAAGALKTTAKAPLHERRDRAFTITVTEEANAAQTVTASAQVTALAVGVKPERARPSSVITFRGRGFTEPGAAVWAHYVRGSKHRKTVKLGSPSGPCGIFTARRRQFPFQPKTGTWRLQIDQQKRYSARPSSVFVRLEIFVRRVLKSSR